MSLFARRRHCPTSRPHSLQVEALESRLLLACNISVRGSTMTITGDATDNVIDIADDGNGTIDVTCDGTPQQGTKIKKLIVNTGDGADTVDYEIVGNEEDKEISGRKYTYDLGNGDDSFSGTGTDLLFTKPLALTVKGGAGADTIDIALDGLLASKLTLNLEGGGGQDDITVTGDLGGADECELKPDKDNCNPEKFKKGKLSIKLLGGDDNDDLTVIGTVDTENIATTIAIDGGAGQDTCVAPPGSAVTNCEL